MTSRDWSPKQTAAYFDSPLTAEDFETPRPRRTLTPAQQAAKNAYWAVLTDRGWPDITDTDVADAWAAAIRVRGEMERGAA